MGKEAPLEKAAWGVVEAEVEWASVDVDGLADWRGVRCPGAPYVGPECQLPAEVLLVARLLFVLPSRLNGEAPADESSKVLPEDGKLAGKVKELSAMSFDEAVPGRVFGMGGGIGRGDSSRWDVTPASMLSKLSREKIAIKASYRGRKMVSRKVCNTIRLTSRSSPRTGTF